VIPLAGPAECRVQGNISGSDKEDQGRCDHQEDGNGRAIVEDLIPNCGVQHENPACGGNGSDVYSGESLTGVSIIRHASINQIRTLRTESSSGNPPTVKISQISTTINATRNNCISLLPTAAFLRSDRHNKKSETRIEMNARMIDPRLARCRSPLRGMPVRAHPSKAALMGWLVWYVKSCAS